MKTKWIAMAILAWPLSAMSAEVVTTAKTCFPAVQWVSQNSSDVVTIQNGNGTPISIQITVNKTTDPKMGAITLRNCGTTTRVTSGSSAICANSDANNPVNFNADSPDLPAAGTYQIQQQ